MKNPDAGRQREVLKDSLEHGRDWAIAGLVSENVTRQLAAKRGQNQEFTQGLGELLDVFRFDMADNLDAQSMARHANVLYDINTSARSGDWSFGNFMAADNAYNQMVAIDKVADASEAAEAANARPPETGPVTVSGRGDVLGTVARSLITEQPISVRPAVEQQPAAQPAATNESAVGKKPAQRRPGFGLFS